MDNNLPVQDSKIQDLKKIAMIIYVLYALACLLGVTGIIAVVMAHIKKGDARGTWLESHFKWQIRTFWFWLLWTIIGAVTIIFLIGYVILLVNFVWYIYRVVKGLLTLNDNKPMYA